MAWPAPHSSRPIRNYLVRNTMSFLLSTPMLALIQIVGVLAFQYTGEFVSLIPGISLIGWTMIQYVKAIVLIMCPGWDITVEISDEPLQNKILLQVGYLSTAYVVYLEGYSFFAGAVTLIGVTMLLAAWNEFFSDENEGEEK